MVYKEHTHFQTVCMSIFLSTVFVALLHFHDINKEPTTFQIVSMSIFFATAFVSMLHFSYTSKEQTTFQTVCMSIFFATAFVFMLHFYDIIFCIAIAMLYVIDVIGKVFNFIVDLHFEETTVFKFTVLNLFYSILFYFIIYIINRTERNKNINKKYSQVSPRRRPSSPRGDHRDLMFFYDD